MANAESAATPRAQTVLAWLAGLAVLYWAKAILIPVALAVLLTFLVAPVVTRLQRIGVPKVAAVIIVVAVAFTLLGGIGYVVSDQMVELAGELSSEETKDRIEGKVDRLLARWGNDDGVVSRLSALFDSVREKFEGDAPAADGAADGQAAASGVPPGTPDGPLTVRIAPEQDSLTQSFEAVLAPLVGPLGTAGLVVVLVIFLLFEREDLRNRLVTLSGQAHVAMTTKALDEAGRGIARYLLMQFVVNVSYGLAVTIVGRQEAL